MADGRGSDRAVAGRNRQDPGVRTVVDFMDTSAAKTDPAFRVPSVYDTQRAVYRPRRGVDDLEQALRFYGQLGLGPRIEHAVESSSWEVILGQISQARETYESKAAGLKGVARKLWRKAGDSADTIAPYLEMIPDDMYLKVLRVGLCWVLSMAQSAAKKREAIFAAFEEIPAVFIKATEKRKVFSSDKEFCERLDELHGTSVWAVSKLIVFLLPKSPWKQAFPAIVSIPTAEEVDAILAKVKHHAHELQERVDSVVEITTVDTNKTTHRIETCVSVTRQAATRTEVQTREISKDINNLSDTLAPVPAKLDELRDELLDRFDRMSARENTASKAHLEAEQHGIDAQNGMKDHLLSVLARVEQVQEQQNQLIRQISAERSMTPQPMSMNPAMSLFALPTTPAPPAYFERTTPQQILSFLDVDLDALSSDLETIFAKHASFSDGQTSRTALLTHPRLRRWLSATSSDTIVVNSPHGDPASLARVNSLSAFCATLIASVKEAQPAAEVLHYFCGLHASDAPAKLAGPAGLIRALLARTIGALYRRGRLDLRFVSSREYRVGLEEWDINIMSDAFVRLMRQFEVNSFVYVVVDGASWCERGNVWQGDMAVVMDAIAVLMEDQQLRPIVKVLVTSPVRSRVVASCMPVENVINLPSGQGVESDDSGVAARLMHMSVGELTPPPPGFGFQSAGNAGGPGGDRHRPQLTMDSAADMDYWT